MSMPYPRGFEDRLDAIERRLDQLFASIQNRAPMTQASQGLILPNRSTPSNPPSGVYIFAQGGEFYVRTSGGGTRGIIPPDPPQGVGVSDPSIITAGTAPGAYSAAHSQALRDDLVALRATVLELIQSLRGGDIIAPF